MRQAPRALPNPPHPRRHAEFWFLYFSPSFHSFTYTLLPALVHVGRSHVLLLIPSIRGKPLIRRAQTGVTWSSLRVARPDPLGLSFRSFPVLSRMEDESIGSIRVSRFDFPGLPTRSFSALFLLRPALRTSALFDHRTAILKHPSPQSWNPYSWIFGHGLEIVSTASGELCAYQWLSSSPFVCTAEL